jgi:hypothetical protein
MYGEQMENGIKENCLDFRFLFETAVHTFIYINVYVSVHVYTRMCLCMDVDGHVC